jgi:hypothetical protein
MTLGQSINVLAPPVIPPLAGGAATGASLDFLSSD